MSNLEINRAMAILLGYKLNEGVSHEQDIGCFNGCEEEFCALVGSPGSCESFDCCNNPLDIIPVAIERKLKIEWFNDDKGDYCNVQSPCGSVFSDDKNPYRAMSICILKMKDAEVK